MKQLIQTVNELFAQIEEAVLLINDEQYQFKSKLLSHATVGQHLRHVIELFQEMMIGYETGHINYEKRKRNYLIETNKMFALHQMNIIKSKLNVEDKKLKLTANYNEDSNSDLTIISSFCRELIYNIEHTVHHQALIKIAFTTTFNIVLPSYFGVAASTLKYQKECVQ